MKMRDSPYISDLIGVPFREHGRSVSDGFDCYGMAIEASRRFGHVLDDLWYRKSNADTFAENADRILALMSGRVYETETQEEGNLVVFFQNGRMVHIGVIVDYDMFLHCDLHGGRIQKLSEYNRKPWKIYGWN